MTTVIKRMPALFLQAVLILIGIVALAFLIIEPQYEGRNVGATLFEIYFNDPFLAIAYLVSIAFFVALYKAFKLLGAVANSTFFSSTTLKSLRTIQYCAGIIIMFVVGCIAYLMVVRPEDDIAGGVALGLFILVISFIVTATTAMTERLVHNVLKR